MRAESESAPTILLVNPISRRGHLDAYARLYARAFLELGCRVLLMARGDAGAAAYIARCGGDLAGRFRYVALGGAAPDGSDPSDRSGLSALRRARLVWQEEGPGGVLERLLTIGAGRLSRLRPARTAGRDGAGGAGWAARLHRRLFPDARRVGFVPWVRRIAALEAAQGVRADLVFFLYLDLMGQGRRNRKALSRRLHSPWSGILFHPREADAVEREGVEGYFRTRSASGALFLVPRLVEAYERALPGLCIVSGPDVADTELPDTRFGLAEALRRRAGDRVVVSQLGVLRPHKGVMDLLAVIERADPARYFFALVGQVEWEGFGSDEPRLRRFWDAPPANVLTHAGYVDDERDYNSLIEATDVIYAVYRDFNDSSNSLTKAAAFRRPVLVSEGTLMAQRVLAVNIGATAPSAQPEAILAALEALSQRPRESFGFDAYAAEHSLEALKDTLAAALPRWCGAAVGAEAWQ